MQYKSLDEIKDETILGLICNQAEDDHIEYKQEFVKSDKDKAELLKDVSAFANSGGGDIIYGMAEVDGIASKVFPIDSSRMDDEKNRIHQILDAGITPRIPNVVPRPIEVEPGKSVMVVRIPPSHIGPHQVTAGHSYKFHGRNTAGTYVIEVDELRDKILRQASLPERMREFRRNRVELVKNSPADAPLLILREEKLIVHFMPLKTFGTVGEVNADEFATNMAARNAVQNSGLPVRSTNVGLTNRPNIDGYVFLSGMGTAMYPFYVQVFRDGSVEFVDTTAFATLTDEKIFGPKPVEQNLFHCYRFVRAIYDALKVTGRIHIFMSLVGLREYSMVLPTQFMPRDLEMVGHSTAIGQDPALFSEVVVEDMHEEPQVALRPLIEHLWHAAAWDRAQSYDKDGKYVGVRES